jgi:CRP-like cAMP-binding protein
LTVEVGAATRGGEDLLVDTMGTGAVVGEMSLPSGDRRSATVRALEGAVMYEIGRHQYAPLLHSHVQLVDGCQCSWSSVSEAPRRAQHVRRRARRAGDRLAAQERTVRSMRTDVRSE